ncbi:hypothetical protein AAFG07_07265 [Bradyrhizobium sp. B097]|uniref:hypothetical protein n=1 Tax=Bradyrhizobium sp. B097 TaxID=3140244 RepID=UPI0031832BB5
MKRRDRTNFAPEMSQSTRNERDRMEKEDNINEADRYPAAHNGLAGGLGFPILISARALLQIFPLSSLSVLPSIISNSAIDE